MPPPGTPASIPTTSSPRPATSMLMPSDAATAYIATIGRDFDANSTSEFGHRAVSPLTYRRIWRRRPASSMTCSGVPYRRASSTTGMPPRVSGPPASTEDSSGRTWLSRSNAPDMDPSWVAAKFTTGSLAIEWIALVCWTVVRRGANGVPAPGFQVATPEGVSHHADNPGCRWHRDLLQGLGLGSADRLQPRMAPVGR